MKKLLITEDEKKHIINLYEKIGDKPTPEMLSSMEGKNTIKAKKFYNKYYNLNLPLDGDWMTKEFNDVRLRYYKEKGITPWICKTNDGWCGSGDEGLVTTKEFEKLNKISKEDNEKLNKGEKINTTFDQYYDYMMKDGKYYFKGKGTTVQKYPNWVEATGKGLDAIKSKVKF
jgi:hypothetical protein